MWISVRLMLSFIPCFLNWNCKARVTEYSSASSDKAYLATGSFALNLTCKLISFQIIAFVFMTPSLLCTFNQQTSIYLDFVVNGKAAKHISIKYHPKFLSSRAKEVWVDVSLALLLLSTFYAEKSQSWALITVKQISPPYNSTAINSKFFKTFLRYVSMHNKLF